MQKTHTFCDGTTVPAGAIVAVPFVETHFDEENYDRAHEFLPFRFVEHGPARRPFTATYNEHRTFLFESERVWAAIANWVALLLSRALRRGATPLS
jgi:hypothetical protein